MNWVEVRFAGNVRAGYKLLVEGTFSIKSSLWTAVRGKTDWSALIPNLILILFKFSYFPESCKFNSHKTLCLERKELQYSAYWPMIIFKHIIYRNTQMICVLPIVRRKQPQSECHTDFCWRGTKGSSVRTEMENSRIFTVLLCWCFGRGIVTSHSDYIKYTAIS
jgi:hypothetical protein